MPTRTDNFNRADGRLGPLWFNFLVQDNTTGDGPPMISSNKVVGSGTGYSLAYRRQEIWAADHRSDVTLLTANGFFSGAAVRCSGKGAFLFFTDGTVTGNYIFYYIPGIGGFSSPNAAQVTGQYGFGISGGGWSPGDRCGFEALGGDPITFNVYRNNVLVYTSGAIANPLLLTYGAPGIFLYDYLGTHTQAIDDWVGTAATITDTPGVYEVNSVQLYDANPTGVHTTSPFDTTGATGIIVSINSHTTSQVLSVLDTDGNSYTLLEGPTDSSGGSSPDLRSWVYFCNAPIQSTTKQIQVTLDVAQSIVMWALAAGGSNPSQLIGEYSAITNGLATHAATPSLACNTGDLVIALAKFRFPQGGSNQNVNGFVMDENFAINLVPVSQIAQAAGNFQWSMDWTPPADAWQTVILGLTGSQDVTVNLTGNRVLSASGNSSESAAAQVSAAGSLLASSAGNLSMAGDALVALLGTLLQSSVNFRLSIRAADFYTPYEEKTFPAGGSVGTSIVKEIT